MELILQKSW